MTTAELIAPPVHQNSTVLEETRDFAPYIDPVPREEVYAATTPAATKTHTPVPHSKVLDSVGRALGGSGYSIGRQAHQLTHHGDRYYGVLEIMPGRHDQLSLFGDNGGGTEMSMLLGIVNTHDKTSSLRFAAGAQVSVCSNGIFNGDTKVSTVHSRYILDRLDRVVVQAVAKYANLINKQREQIKTYKETELTTKDANDLFIRALQQGAISSSKLEKAVKAYNHPPHPEFEERTLWSWVNSITEIHKSSSITTVLQRSPRLHNLADVHCGLQVSA